MENQTDKKLTTEVPAEQTQSNSGYKGRPGGSKPKRTDRQDRGPKDEFDSKVLKVRRVSRMYHGGRRMKFSALVVVGNRTGQVSVSVNKGLDVSASQRKAISHAKKTLTTVPLKGVTIPHEVTSKYKASIVMIKPAAPGTGIVAGAVVKSILDLAGIKDALTKVMGSKNQMNVAKATIEALQSLKSTRL